MQRREAGHVAAVIIAAIIARAILFNYVGIWGDYGFYQYDARLILEGGTPFIDFLGRSPVFIYLYAATAAIAGQSIELVRIFISAWWLLTAAPVYLMTRELHSHRAATAAIAILLLSPFALGYGMWANTQSVAAAFAATAIYLLIRDQTTMRYGAAGVLLALAYLSRRSVIVILAAVGLYTLYTHAHHTDATLLARARTALTQNTTLTVAFTATIFACYALMARFDPHQTWALFEVHTANLFLSYGRGGYPLITVEAPIVTNSISDGRVPIFNDLCQVCGAWTARTLAKTIVVAVPVIGVLWYYIRDWTDHYFLTRDLQYMYGILGVLAAYALAASLYYGYVARAGSILSLILFVVGAYRTDAVDRSVLYDRRLQLVLLVLLGLTAGYLYRNRILHTYYFMDFWPYLSVLTGILFVEAWGGADRRHARVLLAVAIVVGTVSGGATAHPLTVVLIDNNDDGWFTINNLHAYQQDMNTRTSPGDVVFTASPSFVANSHAQAPLDRPRIHMVAVRYKDHGPALPQYRYLINGMRNGTIKYVVFTRTTRQMLRWNDTARRAYLENYCRVASADELYQRANGYLYRHQSLTPTETCPPDRQPHMNISLTSPDADSPP